MLTKLPKILPALILLINLLPSGTFAAKLTTYNYSHESLFQAAYRFLTIDKKFKVTKEDPEMGVLFFTYREGNIRDPKASVEVITDASSSGLSRLRIQVPSISEGTVSMLTDQLGGRIKKDFEVTAPGERVFNVGYGNLYSSVYRFLAVDRQSEIVSANKDRGLIVFIDKETSPKEKSFCEIFKVPAGGHKVRLTIPQLSATSIRVYLNEIADKLKEDYGDS